MVTVNYKNQGTCSVLTTVTLADDHTIQEIAVKGGCNGNLKGVSSLLVGMDAADAIRRMKGTTCGPRSTSCPDQIAQALQETLDLQKRS